MWEKIFLITRWIDVIICIFLSYGFLILFAFGYVTIEATILANLWAKWMADALQKSLDRRNRR